jgi:hypothetical protein
VERRLGSEEVIETLAAVMTTHGIPAYLRSDHGPEFIASALRHWLSGVGAAPLYLAPGSPWENGYCESFNGKLRDKCLNSAIFYSRREAQIIVEQWRIVYNTRRPHSTLGYRPPAPEACRSLESSTSTTLHAICSLSLQSVQKIGLVMTAPGVVMDDIWESINRASVVIAEISEPNQNVWYELGLAQALNKRIIPLSTNRNLPFDHRHFRTLLYDPQRQDLRPQLDVWLQKIAQ